MPSTNFKLFDENKQNLMSDEAYSGYIQRLNGVQTGVASSELQNKTLYQVALMSYALAQIMNQNGVDANDSDEVSTFVNNVSSMILQKVADKATTQDIEDQTSDAKWASIAQIKTLIENLASQTFVQLNVPINMDEWEEDDTYSQYDYKATVTIDGITSNMVPIVSFNPDQLSLGIFAPIANSDNNAVYIYASEIPVDNIIIPSIVVVNE